MKWPPRPVLLLAGIAVVGLVLMVTAALQDSIVYYRTPTEASQSSAAIGSTMRLGGQVLPGSLRDDGASTEFRLTDGRTAIVVIAGGAIPDTFREGQGAVVEGVLEPDGLFRADTVAVKHSNEYRPPPAGTGPGADR
jgi:cytochrome c-type biogenesis protein CcmE